ncbi:50S ribosomal protein L29 [Leptospira sp. GIMC2001]|uniref:50S ribosomal protein L29 n=1 Tax=Leptospira sp. GIMC2001 TaxID=1513297 RepID=UPI002349F071|nr:50S ribosomal protein L29 [Leptospira sp. GIMC2001]WCL51088.1 50S ribosomal protein L29 [Leptospira sp. GIMC2001]
MKNKLHELNDADLKNQLGEAREEIRSQRFKFAVEKNLENPKKIRDTKKKIARILTIQRERDLAKVRQG